MPINVATLEARLISDTRDFDRGMDRSQSKMSGLSKAAGVAGAAIAAGLAVGAKKAVDDASNLNESMNATRVVFGEASNQVAAFSKVAAQEAGLSMRQLNQLVTPIGASLRNTGFSADAAAKASIGLAKRAADMASVFNTDVETALSAIQAGLRGEADPLEAFGVGLSAAKVQAKAMTLGLAETTKGLTAQDLAQARLALVMSESSKVAGDFKNTAGELANQQRINAAEAENQRAKLGQGLLPVMKTYQNLLGTVTGFMGEHTTATKAGVGILAGLAVTLGIVSVAAKVKVAAMGIATAATKAWAVAQWLLNAAMNANPISLVIIGLVALGVALVVAWKKSETFRDIVTGTWDAVKAGVMAVIDFFRVKVPETFTDLIAKATGWGTKIKDGVVAGITGLPADVMALINRIGTRIVEAITTIKGWGASIGGWVKGAVVDALLGIGNAAWNVINNIGDWIAEKVGAIAGWGSSVGGGLKSSVVDALTGIGSAAWEVVNNIGAFLLEKMETIRGWGSSAGGWLKAALIAGVTGIAGGVWNIVNNIWTTFLDKADTIKSWGSRLGNWIKDAVIDAIKSLPGEVFGIVEGIGRGVIDRLPGVGDVAPGFNETAAETARRAYGLQPQTAGLLSTIQAQFGNVLVTSGFRTPEENRRVNGAPNSDHLTGKAFDLVPATGWNAATIALFDRIASFAAALPSVRWIGWRGVPGHGPGDHLHVSTFDKGGFLPTGWSIAGNFTGRPERVGHGTGTTVNFNGPVYGAETEELARKVQQALLRIQRRDGGLGFT